MKPRAASSFCIGGWLWAGTLSGLFALLDELLDHLRDSALLLGPSRTGCVGAARACSLPGS